MKLTTSQQSHQVRKKVQPSTSHLCISFFSRCWDQIPDKRQLRKSRSVSAHGLRRDGPWWWGRSSKGVHHPASAVMEQRGCRCSAPFLVISLGDGATHMSFPCLVKPVWKHPRDALKGVPELMP